MDERKPSGASEAKGDKPVQPDARAMLEQAFARGSVSDAPSVVAVERSEHSVMAGLPADKAERVAAMRRELAELQRQLTEAQQRIATELQGRAEDAERLEAIEAKLHAHEAKAQEEATRAAEVGAEVEKLRTLIATTAFAADELRRDVVSRDAQIEELRQQQRAAAEQLEAKTASLNQVMTLADARAAELEARTGERDAEQASRVRLERELEEHQKQHREASSEHETRMASLRDAHALVATRDTELAAMTTERDHVKAELAGAVAKLRDLATQLVRFGQALVDGSGEAQLHPSTEPLPTVTTRMERPKPPPLPPTRAHAPTGSQKIETVPGGSQRIETIMELSAEPPSRGRVGLALIGGAVLGIAATVAIMAWRDSGANAAERHTQQQTTPSAALVSEHASAPAQAPEVAAPPAPPADQRAQEPSPLTAPPQPEVAAGSAGADLAPSHEAGDTRPAPPAQGASDGVIVLPKEAAEHRLFVDGKVVPVKGSRATVPCGSHEIRIGSHGTARTLDVACGGETEVPADPREH